MIIPVYTRTVDSVFLHPLIGYSTFGYPVLFTDSPPKVNIGINTHIQSAEKYCTVLKTSVCMS